MAKGRERAILSFQCRNRSGVTNGASTAVTQSEIRYDQLPFHTTRPATTKVGEETITLIIGKNDFFLRHSPRDSFFINSSARQ